MTLLREDDHLMQNRSEEQELLAIPNFKLQTTRKGFRYRGPLTWNTVELNIRRAESLTIFKEALYHSNQICD